jgi:hypothetical protein
MTVTRADDTIGGDGREPGEPGHGDEQRAGLGDDIAAASAHELTHPGLANRAQTQHTDLRYFVLAEVRSGCRRGRAHKRQAGRASLG